VLRATPQTAGGGTRTAAAGIGWERRNEDRDGAAQAEQRFALPPNQDEKKKRKKGKNEWKSECLFDNGKASND
jgi:hypothetical protein